MANNTLNTGIAAFKSGNKTAARQLFSEAVRSEPDSDSAWLWLAVCVDAVDQKKYCLTKALTLNPNNQNAREALVQLGQRSQITPQAPEAPTLNDLVSGPQLIVQSNPQVPLSNKEQQPGTTGLVRGGVSQSKVADSARNVLMWEVIILSIAMGIWRESWWVFGGSFLGLMLVLVIGTNSKPLGMVIAVVFGACWGAIAWGIGMLVDKSGAASVVLGVIGFLSGTGMHVEALRSLKDLSWQNKSGK